MASPTQFQNLKAKGTLVVVGLATLASATVTTLVVTTSTVTTANITTANVQTLSGATVNAMQANGIVEALTISGSVLKSFPNSGSGKLLLSGSKGGTLCIYDTDAGGYSQCDTLNGTMTCRIASAGQCP